MDELDDAPPPILRDFYYEIRDGVPVLSEDYT
jgi:hypothetical protein